MKVLHVLSSTNVNSGIANVVMNYYRNIDREKVQFDCLVFSLASNNFDSEINKLGGNVYSFTQPGLRTYFKAHNDLDIFFKEHGKEYNIIHCHEILVAKMVFKYARKYGKVKCIAHSHNTRLSERPIKVIRNKLLVSGLSKYSDYCFACSREAGQNAFGKNILQSTKYKTIFNAIELNKFLYSNAGREKIRDEFDLHRKFVLGNVGRLCAQKNQKFAVDVLRELLKSRKDTRLLLVGPGKEKSGTLDYVKSLNLEEFVIFADSRNDVGDLLSAMDCFVFPSLFEGLPVALVEAQSNGLPIIYFDSLTKEVAILDSLIIMKKTSNPKDWSDKLNSLVSSTEEERLKSFDEMKNAGFDIEEQAKNLKEIYFKIKEEVI